MSTPTPRTDAIWHSQITGRVPSHKIKEAIEQLERELAEEKRKAGELFQYSVTRDRELTERIRELKADVDKASNIIDAHKSALEMAEKALKTFDGVFAFGGIKAHTEEELKLVREAQAAIAKAKGTK